MILPPHPQHRLNMGDQPISFRAYQGQVRFTVLVPMILIYPRKTIAAVTYLRTYPLVLVRLFSAGHW